MKLKLIAECSYRSLVETRHGWEDMSALSDQVATQQSAKALLMAAFTKIRNMLGPMKLVKDARYYKGDFVKKNNQTIEPIGPAVAAFDGLRRVVRAKVLKDVQMLLSGNGNASRIGEFWGFQFPTGYADIIGQRGRVNANGKFDEIIRHITASSVGQPIEARIDLLRSFAQSL